MKNKSLNSFFLTIAILIITVHSYAVSIQFLNLDSKIVNRQFKFNIGGEIFFTNKTGFARIDLPLKYGFSFPIILINDTFKIIYPVNGLINLPKDSNAEIAIVVGKTKDFEIYKTIQFKLDEAHRKIDSSENICNYLKETFESLVKLTQDSIDLRQKRDSVFPIITPVFNRYALNLLNLADAFERFSYTEFKDSSVKKLLNQKMLAYNATFDSLYAMKDVIKKWINDYWRSDILQKDLIDILNKCLEEHKAKVLSIRVQIRGIDDLSRTKKLREKHESEIQEAVFNVRHSIIADLKSFSASLAESINKLNIQLLN